jgi:hypothetical protein
VNIREMIEQLEELAQEHGDQCDVRYASQPSWPLENDISTLAAVNLGGDEEREETEEEPGQEATPDNVVVYLSEGQQLGYLPGAVCKELGWR